MMIISGFMRYQLMIKKNRARNAHATLSLKEAIIIFTNLFSNDGPYPLSPGFEPLEKIRKTECPEFFSQTAGLISQGGYN